MDVSDERGIELEYVGLIYHLQRKSQARLLDWCDCYSLY
jgi:hypothetical protein